MQQHIKYALLSLALLLVINAPAQMLTPVKHFDKVIISPHIQATFIEGNEESVNVEKSTVDKSKLHIEVNGTTLRVYLEGAKDFEKNEKDYKNGYKEKHSIYTGTVVTAVITYKTLQGLSLRGEEDHICKSVLKGDKFSLKIYGESDVTLMAVELNELTATLYGESNLKILAGTAKSQKYVAYGEGKINSLAINSSNSKITAYGEADFKVNVSDEIKITAFGEASLHYTGSPVINKGLHFGDLHIEKMN